MHNIALEVMLASILENLPVQPQVGAKRLLELYSEILSLNNSPVPNQVKQRLLYWTASPGLKKIISSLGVEFETNSK